MSKYLGDVSAYAYAVSKGYTGTEEQFAELMASYADVAEDAAQSASEAAQSATAAAASATNAASSASGATQSAQSASASATSASQSATAATSAVSTAQTAAQTATTKASEASQSATTAQTQAQNAMTHASNAQTFANNAQTSATQAAASATTANDSANLAVEVAESIPEDYTTLSNDVDDLKNAFSNLDTVNLIDPINKSGTVSGITYSFENGVIGLSGDATGRKLMQTITGQVGDTFTLSCLTVTNKPTFYIMNGSTVVATYPRAAKDLTFTLPTTSVTLEFYVAGAFSYEFGLTLVKDEIPSFPLLKRENGINTIVNFHDAVYEAIGDSLTYGFIGWDGEQQMVVNKPYPEKVKEILGMSSAINKGETGTTIANDESKMGSLYPISSDSRLDGYTAQTVISVMGGTNDYSKGTSLGTVNDLTSDTTFHAGWKRILTKLVGSFSASGSFIFVIIPPVTVSLYTDNSAGHKWIDYINATIEECRSFGVPVLDMSIYGRLTGLNKSVYTHDGVHFNQLYISKIFAPMVADFIKRNIH